MSTEIRNKFYPQKIENPEAVSSILPDIRKSFADLAVYLSSIEDGGVPTNSRYAAEAISHLEIAAMFATKMLSHSEN